jgi:hypothetical protein
MGTDTDRPRLSWTVKAAFVASLVLNVALVMQLLLPSRVGGLHSNRAIPAPLEQAMRCLPAADSALLNAAILRHTPALVAARGRARTTAAQSLRLLQTQPLDLPALQQAIADTRQARQGEVDQLLSAVYEAFPQMSADGRKQFAKNWNTPQSCGRQR